MIQDVSPATPVHPWLRHVRVAFVPGPTTPLGLETGGHLMDAFRDADHEVQEVPDGQTDILIGTAPFGEPTSWRSSLLFTGRARLKLPRQPFVYGLVHASTRDFREHIERLARAIGEPEPRPEAFDFPGLAPTAYRVLHEQGRRGGPLMALARLLQGQTKYIRILLVVGDEEPEFAYHFDLVGAYPRSDGGDRDAFYRDIVLRMVTTVSTDEAVHHQLLDDAIPAATWAALGSPSAMTHASLQFGMRDVFTEPVRVADLVAVPAVTDAVASQYSEGCFGTWEPALDGLVVTVTGSARPIDKGRLTEDDLTFVSGIRPDHMGALARRVEGRAYAPPSSEAVEMLEIDEPLARVSLPPAWGVPGAVPILRSKLHAHRGIRSFDRERVEYVPLPPAYHRYLVSCASQAQAHAVTGAIAAAASLRDPDDPRLIVFTVLPGHGVMIAERWIEGRRPFEAIWGMFDEGALELDSRVPQGPLAFVAGRGSRMNLQVPESAQEFAPGA